MKKYTSYQKTEEPYFDFFELLGFPILPLLLIAGVSYLIIFFFGLVPMVLSNVGITVVLTFLYNGLKNASPNGSSNRTYFSPAAFIVSALPSFLLISGLLLLINSGIYIIVTFQHTGVFYRIYFYVWLFVMFALPGLYFLVQQLKHQFRVYYQAYYFTPLSFHVIHDCELLSSNIRITFMQTERKMIADIAVQVDKDAKQVGKSKDVSVSERNEYLFRPIFKETIQIPDKTNRLRICWYSIIEEKYYEDEIDFPFDKLVFVENQYPLDISKFLRGKKTDRLMLHLKQGGEIQLFNKHEVLLEGIFVKSVGAKEEKEKEYKRNVESGLEMSARVNKIKQSYAIEKRAVLIEYACVWQISGTGLEGHNVEIKDVKNNYTTGEPIPLHTFEKRRLPIFFDVDYRKRSWLYIHIDAEKLYDLIQQIGDKEPALTFDLNLDPENGNANLIIKNGEQIVPFAAWEKRIDEYRLQEVQDMFLGNREHFIKNNFLKEIYECIVKKEYSAATNLCKAALGKYPYFPMIYFYEARLLWYNEGFEASCAQELYFIEKTKTDPYALAQIYNHYGCLYDEQKRYVESLARFEKAYHSYPDMLYYLANIAEIHYKLKDAPKAFYYAEECMKKECTLDIITEIIANKGVLPS